MSKTIRTYVLLFLFPRRKDYQKKTFYGGTEVIHNFVSGLLSIVFFFLPTTFKITCTRYLQKSSYFVDLEEGRGKKVH